jgi:hypothetical protein
MAGKSRSLAALGMTPKSKDPPFGKGGAPVTAKSERRDPSLTLDFVEREKRIVWVAFWREKDDSVRRTAQMPG